MSKVAIVTDSTADLPQSLREELNIYTIPLKIQIGSNTYKDGIDFSADEFYRKVRDGCLDIETLQPSPAEFMELYKEISENHSAILSIHVSSELSGTYSSANIAKTMLGEEYEITILDSKLISMALGALVLEVAKAAKEGNNLEYLVDLASTRQKDIKAFLLTEGSCVFDTLNDVQIDQEKPYSIIRVNELAFNFLEGHRNKSKALQEFVGYIHSQINKELKYKIAIIHCDNLEDAIKLQDQIQDSVVYDELIISETSSVVASKIGLGAIGIVLYPA